MSHAEGRTCDEIDMELDDADAEMDRLRREVSRAREEGRRAGIEEAAKKAEAYRDETSWAPHIASGIRALAAPGAAPATPTNSSTGEGA